MIVFVYLHMCIKKTPFLWFTELLWPFYFSSEDGKLLPVGQMWFSACFCKVLEIRRFYIFKELLKKKKRICDRNIHGSLNRKYLLWPFRGKICQSLLYATLSSVTKLFSGCFSRHTQVIFNNLTEWFICLLLASFNTYWLLWSPQMQ